MEPPIRVPCGYQRIFMFPLAPILPFGLFPPDRRIIRSAPAPAVPGAQVASCHLLGKRDPVVRLPYHPTAFGRGVLDHHRAAGHGAPKE
ncbi:hypothetical protein [Sulfuritalea sp.]|uniref:hypothetical protein n=1 Tax=Sulfuritalea sp. TaxID=2480090 RepID=UPI001ACF646D|nr:hypothetical protein [Sulfuritalea sp.]MBN8475283.1 hypothetical protein [Sulfuritalea sp.]